MLVNICTDDPVLPAVTNLLADHPSETERISLQQLCDEFSLNTDQQHTFYIIANHANECSPNPLRMYVGGEAGTGKSRLIHAVTEFFMRSGMARRLRLTSYMGVAARNIKGMTLHAALQLSQRKRSAKTTNDLIAMWQGVEYLFIDEVLMIGCAFLAQLSESLSIAKGNSQPFGGISIIFSGDFAQLPPVAQTRLFSHINTSRVSTRAGQQDVFGKLLWLSVDTVVILSEVMRQGGDENTAYCDLLGRLRIGRCIDADFELLNSRLLSTVVCTQPCRHWHTSPFIVTDNEVKDALNIRATCEFSTCTHRPVQWYYSLDTRRGAPMADQALQDYLSNVQSGSTNQRLGKLPLVIGMPVMIVQNFDISNGIVNGCTGDLVSIRSTVDSHGRLHAHSCVI